MGRNTREELEEELLRGVRWGRRQVRRNFQILGAVILLMAFGPCIFGGIAAVVCWCMGVFG